MASACVNNIGMSPESFLDCPPGKFSPYGWLSPRMSFSREFQDEEASKAAKAKVTSPTKAVVSDEADPVAFKKDANDFEFRLEDPVNMLPADELFSDGKLVPLQLSSVRQAVTPSEVRSPDTPKLRRNDISVTDPYLFSPKAPRCSSRWKELLGLKKLYQNANNAKAESNQKTTSFAATKSLRNFLHRSSRSSGSSSLDALNLPLLKETVENDSSLSLSSCRLSLSSSSSGQEHEDLPRLSLDSDRPSTVNPSLHRLHNHKVRVAKPRLSSTLSSENSSAANVRVGRSRVRGQPEVAPKVRGFSVDSPRMNSSGKIVFHSLERSSSSPSSFNGGPKYNKNRAVERSYSANVVRVTPVLNVPVCSSLRGSSSKSAGVFGFPLFSSSQPKRDGAYHHHSNTNRKLPNH